GTGSGTTASTAGFAVKPATGAAPLAVTLLYPTDWQVFINKDCDGLAQSNRTFAVDWGDGSGWSSLVADKCGHTYLSKGIYTVNARIYDYTSATASTTVWSGTTTATVTSGTLTATACVVITHDL